MQWQYKTILVGFQKDGLLGDKYIDEEETEAVLNAEGRYGWELVTATLVPEGMLFFCKKELLPGEVTANVPLCLLSRGSVELVCDLARSTRNTSLQGCCGSGNDQ